MDAPRPSRRTLVIGLAVAVFAVTGAPLAGAFATDAAVSAEASYQTEHLGNATCLESWGANEGAAFQSASVTGVGLDGVRVNVTVPYAYATERAGGTVHADAASRAVYAVGPTGTSRVSGDEITPCS